MQEGPHDELVCHSIVITLSKQEFESDERRAGQLAGERWAKEDAEFQDLLAVEKYRDVTTESENEISALDLQAVVDADDTIVPDDTLMADIFAEGFVEGALSVLSEVE